jgi:uncharacterized membrane protein
MSRNASDAIGAAIGSVAREAIRSGSINARKASNGRLSGARGVAIGAGLAMLAPYATKGASALIRRGLVKDAVALLPVGGSTNGDAPDERPSMPVQESIDVAVPIKTAYKHWTAFEDWPRFMQRLEEVTKEDASHYTFTAKLWGVPKTFTAEILTKRPERLIKWRATDGLGHSGVVSFHALSDRLTRIDVDVDVHDGTLVEKAARGLRQLQRAIRADLSRFKAHVELEEATTRRRSSRAKASSRS